MKRILGFEYYTEECEKMVVGICQKMGAEVEKIEEKKYLLKTEDMEIVVYLQYLALCDIVQYYEI